MPRVSVACNNSDKTTYQERGERLCVGWETIAIAQSRTEAWVKSNGEQWRASEVAGGASCEISSKALGVRAETTGKMEAMRDGNDLPARSGVFDGSRLCGCGCRSRRRMESGKESALGVPGPPVIARNGLSCAQVLGLALCPRCTVRRFQREKPGAPKGSRMQRCKFKLCGFSSHLRHASEQHTALLAQVASSL